MPPKDKGKGPVEVAPVDGAKFATIRAGTTDHAAIVMINLNCPVDIIIDNVRRIVTKKIETILQELNNLSKATESTAVDNSDTGLSNTVESNNILIAKLTDIKQRLMVHDTIIEFVDPGGVVSNCKDVRVSFIQLNSALFCFVLLYRQLFYTVFLSRI